MGKRHFGNVRLLGSGRYQARYRGPDGRLRPAPHTFANKTDANRWLTDIEHKIHSGTWRDPAGLARTLGDYADEWLEHRPLAESTRFLYRDLLRMHIKPQIGSLPVAAITPADVRRWYADRRQATGPQRLRQAYSLLRTIMGTAVQDGLIQQQPCMIKGAGSTKSPERPFFPREDVARIVDTLVPYMRLPVSVTFLCRLRRGELQALRRGDVDLEAGTLLVQRAVSRTATGTVTKSTKTGRERKVHLPPEALDALRAHLKSTRGLPSDPLFTNPDGRPLSAAMVEHHWEAARESCGLRQYHFHDLRHSGLTYFAMTGATLRETMEAGGHSTPSAAMVYQHVATSRMQSLANSLSLRAPETVLSEA